MALWEDTQRTWNAVVQSVEQPPLWRQPSLTTRRLWLRRANVPIAITGTPGGGKSVFFGALTGRLRPGHRSRISPDWERHRVALRTARRTTRAAVIVVPGQETANRTRSLTRIFQDGNAPVGLVHVVCWGYNEVWSDRADGALRLLRPESTLADNETVRAYYLEQERLDFTELCTLLTSPAVEGRLRWLIIAVAKCDLFWPDINAARDYYIPGEGEPPTNGFQQQLHRLTAVGSNFPASLAVVPFCSRPEEHSYADGLYRTAPMLDALQADALRSSFRDVLVGML